MSGTVPPVDTQREIVSYAIDELDERARDCLNAAASPRVSEADRQRYRERAARFQETAAAARAWMATLETGSADPTGGS